MLDLARELRAAGHEVSFYSFVPRRRAETFGLHSESQVSLLPFLFPLVAWDRIAPRLFPRVREWLMFKALNWIVMFRMRPCDAFIFMSGIYLEAARAAKRRYGARLWLERGSQHILAQQEILTTGKGEQPSYLAIKREMEGYATADRIIVASTHVEKSFSRDCALPKKLFKNAYGVDTTMFNQKQKKTSNLPIKLLYVGSWSLRKGCDLLTEAVRSCSDVRLTHVGSMGDYPFPSEDDRFLHIETVPQWKLRNFYEDADGFILASREDGFGMVLSQALATGLPIIGTDHTGAADLALTPSLAERIFVVPHNDAVALAKGIAVLRDRLIVAGPFPHLLDEDRDALSWGAYGRRYNAELLKDFSEKPH